MPDIVPLQPQDTARWLPQLIVLLQDAAEQLYTGMGYTRVGVIPRFALSSSGTLDATVVFCRELST